MPATPYFYWGVPCMGEADLLATYSFIVILILGYLYIPLPAKLRPISNIDKVVITVRIWVRISTRSHILP